MTTGRDNEQHLLRRFTNGSGTTILAYPFGIEEHQYSGAGVNQSNVYYYYFLAGHLLGRWTATAPSSTSRTRRAAWSPPSPLRQVGRP